MGHGTAFELKSSMGTIVLKVGVRSLVAGAQARSVSKHQLSYFVKGLQRVSTQNVVKDYRIPPLLLLVASTI